MIQLVDLLNVKKEKNNIKTGKFPTIFTYLILQKRK